METFAAIVEVVAVAFWSLGLVFLLGLIVAHWRAEFRAQTNGEHSSLRPNRLLLERRIGDLDVVVTWRSGTSFVGSTICYDVRWSSEDPSLTLVHNPPLDVSAAMTMPVTSRRHPEFGTTIHRTRISRLRSAETEPDVVDEWLTSAREAAIAHLLAGPCGRAGSRIRLECSDVALQLSVPEGADDRQGRTETIDWLLGAVSGIRSSPDSSQPTDIADLRANAI